MLEDQLRENAELGASIIKEYLGGKRQGGDFVKTAMLSVTQYAKVMATKGNLDTVKFMIGRSISKDQDELKGYIQSHMPDYGNLKKLK